MNLVHKIKNYDSVKMSGYAFFNLTYGMSVEQKEKLLENYSYQFSTDEEVKVFKDTVTFPYDTYLYSKLLNSKLSNISQIAEELGISEDLVKDKCSEYVSNGFGDFIEKFGIEFSNKETENWKK